MFSILFGIFFLEIQDKIVHRRIQMKTRLKEVRKEKGLSQIALATKLEISQSTISKMENDELIPNADILCRYSSFFHVSVDYLLFQSNEKIKADDLLQVNPSFMTNKTIADVYEHMNNYQRMKFGEFLDSMRNHK